VADSKISALTGVSSIDGTQEYVVNDGGTTRKATGTQQSQYTETRLQQGVLCSMSGSQAIGNAAWEALAFDAEIWKVGIATIHSTSSNNTRLAATVTGEWMVTGVIDWEPLAEDIETRVRVYKNGTTELWRVASQSINSATWGSSSPIHATVQLTSGDYIELGAYHNRGSDYDTVSAYTRFGMYLVGR